MMIKYPIENLKPININEFFLIEYGNKFDKCNMIETASRDIAFITRTGANNGVGTYVEKIDDVEPYKPGCLTVALGGSLGATFLQSKPFYTAQNIAVLIPRTDKDICWTPELKIFFATLIKKECETRFIAFGRELNTHIKSNFFISLPHTDKEEIDWQRIQNICDTLSTAKIFQTFNNSISISLNTSQWKKFKIKELFPGKHNLKRGKVHSREKLPDGNECFYIGAKKKNNGIEEYCGYDKELINEGNCIAFICNGQGSVGYALYLDREFMASGDVALGYNDNLDKYNGLFLVTILDKERFKYSFGRKYGKYLPDTEILLPAKDTKTPDWEYMSNFIKQLPYGDLI